MAHQPKEPPRPFSGSRYHENTERAGDADTCAVCGRAIEESEAAQWAEVVDGGARFARRDENADTSDAGSMGCWAVGATCARLVPTGYLTEKP